ncbi:MAG: hypothetical protein EXR77_17120 [Myxococcales bacterium]|nr:hypothetical protein [Myxococcales bacterium]
MDAEGQRLLARLPQLLSTGAVPAVLVTVFSTQGSVPRRPGARMLCCAGQLVAGTVGGGHLEDQALRDAHWASHNGAVADPQAPTPASEVRKETTENGGIRWLIRYPLGAKLAQCCGGVVWLHFEHVDRDRACELAEQVKTCERSGQVFETEFGDAVLREMPKPLPVVLILGAGHVAAALAQVLQPLPWHTLVIDERPQWADAGRFAPTVQVVCAHPLTVLAAWGWIGQAAQDSAVVQRALASQRGLPPAPQLAATYALVMTHDHALDRDVVETLLLAHFRTGVATAPLPYVGLIGSRSKVAATQQRLVRRGVPTTEISRLVAPIGLHIEGQRLGGNLPGEIAIAVAAQLLTVI